jgi:hypothetical protein
VRGRAILKAWCRWVPVRVTPNVQGWRYLPAPLMSAWALYAFALSAFGISLSLRLAVKMEDFT